MNLLTVDFDLLLAIVVGLFALTGFLRGWWREGVTTILLLALVVFLTQPELVTTIIEFINKQLTLIGLIVETKGDLDLTALQAAAATAAPPFELDPSNRNLYVALLVGLVLLSYFGSRLTLPSAARPGVSYEPSMGARLVGGVLGAFNGFVVVNLIIEYVVGRLIPETGVSTATAAPSALSVQVANVPPETVFSGSLLWIIIVGGAFVMLFTLGSRIQDVGLGGIKSRAPLGYAKIVLEPKKEKKEGSSST
jgi:hypothetical protein